MAAYTTRIISYIRGMNLSKPQYITISRLNKSTRILRMILHAFVVSIFLAWLEHMKHTIKEKMYV